MEFAKLSHCQCQVQMDHLLNSPSIQQSPSPEPSLQCPSFEVDEEEEINVEIKRENPENLSSPMIKIQPSIIQVETRTARPTLLQENTTLGPEITDDNVAQRSEGIPMDDVQEIGQLSPVEMIKHVFVRGKTLFRCAVCGYKSKWKSWLEQHVVVHSDQKPYACPIDGCKFRSKRLQTVKTHARTAHGLDWPSKMKLKSKENSR